MIITFCNHKGGVGKTTMALITAEALIDDGQNVFLYDTDAQRNFTEKMTAWINNIDENAAVDVNTTVENIRNKSDGYTIIDTAPGLDEATKKAIIAADVIVVPLIAEPAAITGLADVIRLKPKGKIVVIHNNFDKLSAYEKGTAQELAGMVQQIQEKGVKVEMVTLPRCRFLTPNIANGEFWAYRMSEKIAQPFLNFVEMLKKGA